MTSVAPAPPAPPAVQELLADLHHLPGHRPALLRVISVADDPDASARTLADAVAVDPAFATRLLLLANSAYYGRAGRVTSIVPAVTVLGAETLRGLAVTMALGLSGEHGPLPPGFWERAATTAAASRLVAPRLGAEPGDAFCVGLLREVGQALLFRAAPDVYGDLQQRLSGAALDEAELAWCGTTSGELAGTALRAAGLPEAVCRAVTGRRSLTDPLARALRAGSVIAQAVVTGEVDDATTAAFEAVVGGPVPAAAVRELALRTAAQAAALSASMR